MPQRHLVRAGHELWSTLTWPLQLCSQSELAHSFTMLRLNASLASLTHYLPPTASSLWTSTVHNLQHTRHANISVLRHTQTHFSGASTVTDPSGCLRTPIMLCSCTPQCLSASLDIQSRWKARRLEWLLGRLHLPLAVCVGGSRSKTNAKSGSGRSRGPAACEPPQVLSSLAQSQETRSCAPMSNCLFVWPRQGVGGACQSHFKGILRGRTEQHKPCQSRSQAAVHDAAQREIQAVIPVLVDVKLLWPLSFRRLSRHPSWLLNIDVRGWLHQCKLQRLCASEDLQQFTDEKLSSIPEVPGTHTGPSGVRGDPGRSAAPDLLLSAFQEGIASQELQ